MQDYLESITYPPSVGRFNNEQTAQRSTWSGVPDETSIAARMMSIRIVPANSTTVTTVNPLDPYWEGGWVEIPGNDGEVIPAGQRL